NDFGKEGEYLLAPRKLGLPKIPQLVADTLRRELLLPLHVDLKGPAGVAVVLVGKEACFYNFCSEGTRFGYQGTTVELAPHQCLWSNIMSSEKRSVRRGPHEDHTRTAS